MNNSKPIAYHMLYITLLKKINHSRCTFKQKIDHIHDFQYILQECKETNPTTIFKNAPSILSNTKSPEAKPSFVEVDT
jgi:hypothetical protein